MLDFRGSGRWGKAEDIGNLEIKQSCSISKVVEDSGRQRTLETSKSSSRTQFRRWWKAVMNFP